MELQTVTTKTANKERSGIGGQETAGNGSGGHRGPGGDGDGGNTQLVSTERYRIGMLAGLAAITMMFVGLVSAYIIRALSPRNDWVQIAMPPILWASTSLILISSFAFEFARRSLLVGKLKDYSRWLFATAWLGLLFIAAQLWAWRQLVAQGIYLSTNPHSSFFYTLTALHGLHLLGGVIALIYLVQDSLREKAMNAELYRRRVGLVEAARLYWHFMDCLWVFLFLLMFFWK
jgi:cytochrome c oxidase subunit 3